MSETKTSLTSSFDDPFQILSLPKISDYSIYDDNGDDSDMISSSDAITLSEDDKSFLSSKSWIDLIGTKLSQKRTMTKLEHPNSESRNNFPLKVDISIIDTNSQSFEKLCYVLKLLEVCDDLELMKASYQGFTMKQFLQEFKLKVEYKYNSL